MRLTELIAIMRRITHTGEELWVECGMHGGEIMHKYVLI